MVICGSIILIFGGMTVLLLLFLLGGNTGLRVFLDDIVILASFHLRSLSALLVDHPLLLLVFLLFVGGRLIVTSVH